MALSTQRAVSDGTLDTLILSIDYFQRDDITVYFNDIAVPLSEGRWEWVGTTDKVIAFDPVVPAGVEVRLVRATDMASILHKYANSQYGGGAQFTAGTLDENFLQILYLAQEFVENGGGVTDFFHALNMHGYQIKNLGPGTAPGDAVTLGQYQADAAGAYAAALAAQAALAQVIPLVNSVKDYLNPLASTNLYTATEDYSIPVGHHGTSVGPITISTGATVTVPTGSKWIITE